MIRNLIADIIGLIAIIIIAAAPLFF